uniref:Uncharacterized protein n=1 Tax=Oryza meridionalis TaxID=40149 RepID=A0A0E0CMC9_9ORYZ
MAPTWRLRGSHAGWREEEEGGDRDGRRTAAEFTGARQDDYGQGGAHRIGEWRKRGRANGSDRAGRASLPPSASGQGRERERSNQRRKKGDGVVERGLCPFHFRRHGGSGGIKGDSRRSQGGDSKRKLGYLFSGILGGVKEGFKVDSVFLESGQVFGKISCDSYHVEGDTCESSSPTAASFVIHVPCRSSSPTVASSTVHATSELVAGGCVLRRLDELPKYVLVVLRADDGGEDSIFALYFLICRRVCAGLLLQCASAGAAGEELAVVG